MPAWRRVHTSRTCPSYSALWAGDTRMKIHAGLRAYDPPAPEAKVRMVTVTAPGVEQGLPWDEAACAHLGPHRHSGTLGCKVYAPAAALFNDHAAEWWRVMHGKIARSVERRIGRPALLGKAWEMQRRGVLHIHLVFGYSTPRERAQVDAYVAEVERVRQRHGFGYVDRKAAVKEAGAAAAYLAAYFAGGKGGKIELRESVKAEGMPPQIVYVKPELMQRSGLSMRTLRLRRFLWHRIGPGWLRHLPTLGLDLESAFEIVRHGFWGRAFLNSVLQPGAP